MHQKSGPRLAKSERLVSIGSSSKGPTHKRLAIIRKATKAQFGRRPGERSAHQPPARVTTFLGSWVQQFDRLRNETIHFRLAATVSHAHGAEYAELIKSEAECFADEHEKAAKM